MQCLADTTGLLRYEQLIFRLESPLWKTLLDSWLLSELLSFILNIRESIRGLDVGPDLSHAEQNKQSLLARNTEEPELCLI